MVFKDTDMDDDQGAAEDAAEYEQSVQYDDVSSNRGGGSDSDYNDSEI